MTKNDWFTITRVHPCVWALAEFGHWEKVVSYLFIGDTEAALFDSGMGYGDVQKVVGQLTGLPIQVFLTHAHWDHIGGVSNFDTVYIYNNEFECNLLRQGFASKNIPELMNKAYFQKPYLPRFYAVKGAHIFKTVSDRQEILCGGYHVVVIHTPGHTPGSACYLIKELDMVFTGDTLYPGPLYVQLAESDKGEFIASIKKLCAMTSKETLFFPGHNVVSCQWNLLSGVDYALSKGLDTGDGFSILLRT